MSLGFAAHKIEQWPLDRLRPYAGNAKEHGEDQVAKIAASMSEFGWTVPALVAEDGELIAGHGRVLAAERLGLTEAPVIVLGHLTEDQRRAYRVADNKLSELAEWNEEALARELQELIAADYDVSLTGFSDDEMDAILRDLEGAAGEDENTGGVEGEDETPEPPADPATRSGDMWVLGNHRLLCGDSVSATDVERVLGGHEPLLMVTDPPYGVEYDPSWRHRAGVNVSKRTGKVANDDRADWREAWALFPGDVAYVWHGALHAAEVADSLVASGFAIRSQIVWAKDRLVLGRGDYHWQHEPCWYAVKKGGKGHWAGDRKQTTLWQIPNTDQDAKTEHGTQKPVECMRRPMLNNSQTGDPVYEPFMGSGTTLIAAQTTGRVCLGIEFNPAYVDMAVARWQRFTGKQAVLDGDGRSFDEVREGRAAA
ncbi:DNA methylase [Rhodobacteraceae bacterium WD3A24]|nr:DNA methylase [Rhodobacteraceae bacterium WD3A24]